MAKVYVANSVAHAHLVAGLLEEAGIPAFVEGEFLTGGRFELPADASTLPTVCVRDEDVARAVDVLRRHEAAAGADGAGTPRGRGATADDEPAEERSTLRGFRWFLLFALVVAPVAAGLILVASFAPAVAAGATLVCCAAAALLWARRRRGPA